MEKASNNKKSTKLSNMFQKAMSISHSGAPFSPARDFHQHRTHSTANRGAARVRRSSKTEAVFAEPTSPKVSCTGQIKLDKPKNPVEKNKAPKNLKKEKVSFLKQLKHLFSTRKSNSSSVAAASEDPVAVPSLSKMKKFASSGEALSGFDWTVQMRRQESQTDKRRDFDTDDEDLMIPYSVSIPLDQLEALSHCPKSEVNLWKRRSMDQPKPLQVKPTS